MVRSQTRSKPRRQKEAAAWVSERGNGVSDSAITEFRTLSRSLAHIISFLTLSSQEWSDRFIIRLLSKKLGSTEMSALFPNVYVEHAVLSGFKFIPPPLLPPHYLPRHGYNPFCHSGRYCASIHFSSPPVCLSRSSKKKRFPLSSWSKTVADNWKFTRLS